MSFGETRAQIASIQQCKAHNAALVIQKQWRILQGSREALRQQQQKLEQEKLEAASQR